MTKEEILGMVKLSRVTMIIDRLHLKKYGGIFREIVLISRTEIRVDFLNKENKLSNEGELSIYFEYESFDKMISAVEIYTGKNITEWKRYFTDPEIFYGESPEWNEEPNGELFINDFNNGLVELPTGYIKSW